MTGATTGNYAREVGFYLHLQPRLTIPTPDCYHAAIEQSTQDFVILLEDMAPAESAEQLRYAASVGAHHGVLVQTDGSAWDPQRTARALTAAIESLEEDGGVFDLILFGNESAGSGGFQVGVRVAHALGRPIVNGIKGIEIDGSTVRVRREIDGGFEVYELALPAALGVKEGINLPRYPTMRGRLASKKLAITTLDIDAAAGDQAMVRLHRPAETVSQTVILGHGPEAAPAVVDVLEELGVL